MRCDFTFVSDAVAMETRAPGAEGDVAPPQREAKQQQQQKENGNNVAIVNRGEIWNGNEKYDMNNGFDCFQGWSPPPWQSLTARFKTTSNNPAKL